MEWNKDLKQVLKIYKEGIETGLATFETIVPSEQTWDDGHHATLRFVAEEHNRVVGWIAISPVSTRAVYSELKKLVFIYRVIVEGKVLLQGFLKF
ncbi:GNAT family N-acetyltransferase [Lysinibacillus fusiformis]|uniref:GNAT family N-acetyltransferase n=1 Tax=Lysinibacillus fusiformis TaxID=28031 RepID=UPI003556F965